jgi:hypothetical protein
MATAATSALHRSEFRGLKGEDLDLDNCRSAFDPEVVAAHEDDASFGWYVGGESPTHHPNVPFFLSA